MKYKLDRKKNELTAIIGREKMDVLADVVGKEKWEDYRQLWDRASNLEDLEFPPQIDFELNGSCNLRCPMCPMGEVDYRKQRDKTMEIELFKKLIDEGIPLGLKSINLSYVNEPLIRKDLVDFISYAKEKGIADIYFSTNGLLLTDEICIDLIKSGLTRIQISLDAINPDTYDKIRIGGNFNKAYKNIEKLLEIRKELNSKTPLIRVNFVKTEVNESEINDFVEFWIDKVDMIGVQEMINPFNVKKLSHSNSVNEKINNFSCAAPFREIVVTHRGDVLPCCTFLAENMPIGNIKDNSILEIYNSPKMRQLKKIHKKGEYWLNKNCKQCIEGSTQ